MTVAALLDADITPLNGAPNAVVTFGALALLVDLLFVGFTVAQARAQRNPQWWIWGLVTLALPFLGYLTWRLFGATDDGSPDQLFPH